LNNSASSFVQICKQRYGRHAKDNKIAGDFIAQQVLSPNRLFI